MSRTVGQRFLFGAMVIVAGFIFFVSRAGIGVTKEGNAGQVRMTVDPTVLPVVLPDGNEAPANATASEAPSPAPAPKAQPHAKPAVKPKTPAPKPTPKAKAPAPKPAPAPKAKAPAPKATPAPAAKAAQGKPAPTPRPKVTPPAKKGTQIIKSVVLTPADNGFTLTIAANGPVGDTSYFNLSSPRRLVIDLRKPWALKTRNVIRAANGPVKHIVIGEHADRLRMVIHFRTPPAQQLTPAFTRTGNTLKIFVPMR